MHLYDKIVNGLDHLRGGQLATAALGYFAGWGAYGASQTGAHHAAEGACYGMAAGFASFCWGVSLVGLGKELGEAGGRLVVNVTHIGYDFASEEKREKIAVFRDSARKTGKLIGMTAMLMGAMWLGKGAVHEMADSSGQMTTSHKQRHKTAQLITIPRKKDRGLIAA